MWTEKFLGKISERIIYSIQYWFGKYVDKKSNIYTHLDDIRYEKTRRNQGLHLLAFLPAVMGWWEAAARVSVCVEKHNTWYSDRESEYSMLVGFITGIQKHRLIYISNLNRRSILYWKKKLEKQKQWVAQQHLTVNQGDNSKKSKSLVKVLASQAGNTSVILRAQVKCRAWVCGERSMGKTPAT